MSSSVRTQIIQRIRERCQERGVDAYLAYTPSNVLYTTGFQSFFLSEWWRMLGTVLVLVPADPSIEPAMLISDFEAEQARRVSGIRDVRSFRVWVELRNASDLQANGHIGDERPRPTQFEESEQDTLLRSILADRDLLEARVGSDLRYMLHNTVARVSRCAPRVQWVDMTEDLYDLRSIKYDFEIEALRRATEISEAGMMSAVTDLRPGLTALDIRRRYGLGVIQHAMSSERYLGYSDHWVLPALGSGTRIGVDSERDNQLERGDVIKFDCGVTFDGYRSDGGRTFSYREIRPATRRLYTVLAEAHEKARACIRPGTPIRTVFEAAESHIRLNGYPRFNRGHYGHSIGIDTFHEEPPYIGGTEERVMQPGMVFAVETPAYSSDVGAIMIEDLVVVTADGHEVLHQLPHELAVIG